MAARGHVPRYPIKAVSRLTGVGIDTLRAWERRHAAVAPARDERGRSYSEADVQRLRLLRDAVARGHSIGRIARLSTGDLEALAAERPAPAGEPKARPATVDIEPVIDALHRFDTAAVEAALGRAAVLLTPAELLQQVIVPVMTRVGDEWCSARANVAHEHLVSAVIRNVLGSFLHVYGRPQSPVRVLLATPAGERHELGVLGAALLAASAGLDAIYLGADLPAADLIACVRASAPDAVILGVTAAERGDAVKGEVAVIAERLPKDVELWLGGRAAGRIGEALGPRVLVLTDYLGLEQQLARIAG